MRDLLVWLTAAWALGIGLAAWHPLGRELPLLVGAGALAAGCAPSRYRQAALLVAALAGGGQAFSNHPNVARPLSGPVEVTLEGHVLAPGADGVLLGRARALSGTDLPGTLRVRDPQMERGETSLAFAGDRRGLRLRARLRPAQPLRNPGDGQAWHVAASRGGVGRLTHPGLWVHRDGEAAWDASVGALRDRVARRLIEEGQGGALLAALAVGRRDGLEPARRDAIARTGLGHLLAVSGLHLALVAGLAFALARRSLRMSAWLGARFDTRPMAVLLSWVAASAYALLSGGAAPVQRAWVCLSLPVVALLIERSGRLRVSLSAALLLLLVLDPLALFSPGAQLSFVAAAALGRDIVQGPDRGALVSLVRASATAMVATAPLVALHFAPVAPTALPLNWVAVPWTSFVLLPAALVGAAAAICQCGEGWIAGAASLGELSLAAIDAIAGQLGERPGPGPSAGAIVLSSVMAGATLRAAGTLARLVGCGLVTALLAFAPPGVVEPLPPRLVVLDVGQGDAILVQGTGAAVLIDAGVAGPGGLDRGRDVVLPALRALGVRRLDVVVVTHGDLDHRGGVPSVLAEMPVARLWLTAGARSDPRYAEVVESARRGGVVIEEQGAGSPEELVGDLRLRALWPPADGAGASSNDRSLVLSIAVGGRRVLLPGDLELEGEHGLLALEDDLRADVLLLGHHGSRTSTSVNFLAAVSPSVALVSAPCLGRFAMPHAEVVRRLRARGVPFHWTGRDGALRVALDSELVVSGTGRRRSHCGVPLWNDGL